MFFKIAVLKKFAIFTGKHLSWSLFLIKMQGFMPATLSKRDSNTGVFSRIFKNSLFIEHVWWLLRLTLKSMLKFYLVLNFLQNYSMCGFGNDVVKNCYNQ